MKSNPLFFVLIAVSGARLLMPVASAQVNYTNPLTNQTTLSNFYKFIDTNHPTAGDLRVDPSIGLTFTNSGEPFHSSYVYSQPIPASNSWTAKVRVHNSQKSAFFPNGNGAWIWAGLALFKFNTNIADINEAILDAQSQGNVAAKFVQTEFAPNVLTNVFVSKFESWPFVVSAEDFMGPHPDNVAVTDLWVSLTFDAFSKKLTYGFSRDGTNYSQGPSWNLAQRWGINDSNNFVIGIVAENADLNDASQVVYNVKPGELYLRDFSIASALSSGARILTLEGSTNLLSTNWSNIPLSTDRLDASGNINIGASASTNNFYRMRIRVQP